MAHHHWVSFYATITEVVVLSNVANASQLTRGANDWAGFAVKAEPGPTDRLLIEDAGAGGAKRAVTLGALRGRGGNLMLTAAGALDFGVAADGVTLDFGSAA